MEIQPAPPEIPSANIFLLLQAADRLGLSYDIINRDPLEVHLHHLDHVHKITTTSLGLNLLRNLHKAYNKQLTHDHLQTAHLPLPEQQLITSVDEYLQDLRITYPQVIKPVKGQKGIDVFPHINDQAEGLKALNQVFASGRSAIVESHITGVDVRVLMLDYQPIAAAKRHPPEITGDGLHTIAELINHLNKTRNRAYNQYGYRQAWRVNRHQAYTYLHKWNFEPTDILVQDKSIKLLPVPNFSRGGIAETIPLSSLSLPLLHAAREATQTLDLRWAGIDFIVNGDRFYIIEVNSDPSLRIHEWPNLGAPQVISDQILQAIINHPPANSEPYSSPS